MFRTDAPPDIHTLAGAETDLATAAESIHYHRFHEGNYGWKGDPLDDHIKVVDLLIGVGMTHKGYDYPDWRQFSVLDFSAPTRAQIRTVPAWYEAADFLLGEDRVKESRIDVSANTAGDLLHMLKDAVGSARARTTEILLLMLAAKYVLIRSDRYTHDTYMPVYLDLTMRALSSLNAHQTAVSRDAIWPMLSTVHLWPYEVGLLDAGTFCDPECWMITNYSLLSWTVGNDGR